MCNKLYMRLKISGIASPRCGFIPCGKCEDCRNAMKNGWTFRLRVELDELVKKGWKIGFYTLTYANEHLPYLPEEFFVDNDPFKPLPQIPCFSKSDIRSFFVKLKKFLHDNYDCRLVKDKKTKAVVKDTRIRYMLCSEYGEHTQRPHYHGIVCFPPEVPERVIFDKIHELWTLGHVFPRYFDGGYDSHGYAHKPFICSSVKAAAVYASKYCCKDIAWHEMASNWELHKKAVRVCYDLDSDSHVTPDFSHTDFTQILNLRDYQPFHYQSKSLGASFLNNLTDNEKLRYLKVGYHFVGDDRCQGLPIYLRNKILFNPIYIVDERGKRLVRREALKFFRENMDEIYQQKVDKYVDKYSKLLNMQYWESVGIHLLEKRDLDEALGAVPNETPKSFADFHLCYFGVPHEESFDIKNALQWFRRYDPEYVDCTDASVINGDYHRAMHYAIYVLNMLFAKYEFVENQKKRRDNREIARIHDYWSSQE